MPRTLQLTNTLTRAKEDFHPLRDDQVGVYCCGPTVSFFAHPGNLMSCARWDVLVKALRRFGYTVKHVMNITDVGHLSSDADEGDDKMVLAMKREGKSPWDIARFYEDAFFKDCAELNIKRPDVVCRATEHIAEMIEMVKKLEANGYTYTVDGNVYFDTAKFPDYGVLWGSKRSASAEYARVEADSRKKNPEDFVLWFTLSKFPNQVMKWPSPWGEGFPGWHIECSAMSAKYLGEQFDIHCGGADLTNIHHTNEIAQSEGCFCHNHPEKTPWVRYWLHNEFLIDAGGKISKSKGAKLSLALMKENGAHPLAFRLLILGSHYRSQMMFGWDALMSAQSAYVALLEKLQEWSAVPASISPDAQTSAFIERFDAALADDLNTPAALAVFWEAVRSTELTPAQKRFLISCFDEVFSLGLTTVTKGALSPEEQTLLDSRAAARAAKEWKRSDELRDQLAACGILVKDTPSGQEWVRKG